MSRLIRKGFTLVEVIVVLTILAIASATVVPSFTGYIDQSNNKKCAVELAAIQRQYEIERELGYNGGEEAINADSLLKKAVETYGGSYTGGMSFVGPCGTAGCKAAASEDGTRLVSIKCPVHSGGLTKYEIGRASMDALVKDETLKDYFSTRAGGSSLDSNGKNFAPDVNASLSALGFDQSDCEWRAYLSKDKKQLEVYWTDNCLDGVEDGKYRFVKCTYSYPDMALQGTATGYCLVQVKTVEGKTFTVLNVGEKATQYDEVEGTAWQID